MPAKDGWETLARIREVSDGPVIMPTARGDRVDVLRGFSLGADDMRDQALFHLGNVLGSTDSTRRWRGLARLTTARVLRAGDPEVELKKRGMSRCNGELIALTPPSR